MYKLVKETVAAIVRDEVRKGNLGELSSVMERVPDLFNALDVDVARIQNEISDIIRRSGTGNPLNAILSLFGLRMIREDCAERDGAGASILHQCFTIDSGMMEKQVAAFASALADYTKRAQEKQNSLNEDYNQMYQEVNKLRDEFASARRNWDAVQHETVGTLQQIYRLAIAGDMESVLSEIAEASSTLGYQMLEAPQSQDDRNFDIQKTEKLKKPARQVNESQIYVLYPAMKSEKGDLIKGFAYDLSPEEETGNV